MLNSIPDISALRKEMKNDSCLIVFKHNGKMFANSAILTKEFVEEIKINKTIVRKAMSAFLNILTDG